MKNFATGKDDKKRAYEMLLNSGLAQGKVKYQNCTFHFSILFNFEIADFTGSCYFTILLLKLVFI